MSIAAFCHFMSNTLANRYLQVDNFGGIDSFIEFRATRSDVKSDFLVDDPKCIWSGRTGRRFCEVRPSHYTKTGPFTGDRFEDILT